MDYRYYYETLETASARGARRAPARNALTAGLAAGAAIVAAQALGSVDAPMAALACVTTAGLAFALEAPLRRGLAGLRALMRSPTAGRSASAS